MDTLLHAPIQTSVQQSEYMDSNHEATNKTILFSDDNVIDMTASNTITITQTLVEAPEVEEKHQKIDFKSFLDSINVDSEVLASKSDSIGTFEPGLTDGTCYTFQSKPQTYSKKSSAKDFLSSLKPPEENVKLLVEENDKENVFTCVPEGLDSLLPTPLQQSKWHISNTYKQTRSHDETVFSDENDMDITASNTVIITQNLKGNTEAEKKPKKIDFVSFLAGLNTDCKVPALTSDCTRTSEPGLAHSTCFIFQSEQQIDLEKNNIEDFTSSLKPPKEAVKPLVELENEKENLFTCVPEANILSRAKKGYSHSHTQENSNITHCSRELDNATDMTQYHSSDVKTIFSTANLLANQIGIESTGSGRMNISGTQYLKVSCHKSNLSNNLTEVSFNNSRQEKESHIKKMEFAVQCPEPDPKICYKETTEKFDDEMDITRSHTVLISSSDMKKTDSKGFNVFSMFGPPDCKTGVCESLGDIALSKNHTIAVCGRNSRAASSISFNETSYRTGKVLSSVERDNIFIPSATDMDVTKSHTVAIDNLCTERQQNIESEAGLADNLEDNTGTRSSESNHRSEFSTLSDRSKQIEFLKSRLSSGDGHIVTTKSHMLPIDNMSFAYDIFSQKTKHIEKDQNLSLKKDVFYSSAGVKPIIFSEKTVVFSKDGSDIDKTNSHTVSMKVKTVLPPIIPEDRSTVVSVDGDDLELAKSDSILRAEQLNFQVHKDCTDKTVIFSEEINEMDITKSNTIAIDKFVDEAGGSSLQPLERNNNRKNIDQTIIFSKAEDDMDLCKSHSMAINRTFMLLGEKQHLPVPPVNSDKTVVFTCDQDEMDITKSHTVAIDNRAIDEAGGSNTKTLQRNGNRKSMTGLRMSSFPIDQTIVFSKTEDDMDLTNNYSMAVNRNSMLLGERQRLPMPPVSDEKTVVFVCDQAEMDITKSHTVAIDKIVDDTGCPSVQPLQRNSYRKSINESANLSVPAVSGGNTVVLTCDQDEMDITKSHTVAIDNRVVEEARNSSVRTSQRNSNRKSMTGLRMSSFPIDQTVVFSKTEDDMDLTNNYSMTVNRNPMLLAERHRFPVPPVSDEKTVVFVCDQAEMDITKSLTVAIDNKVVDDTSVLPLQRSTNRKNMTDRANLAVPAVSGDKTVVFSCNQDEMDITKSHTGAIDYRVVDEAEGSNTQTLQRNSNRKSMTGLRMSSFPIDQTIALSKTEDDMDLTKSHSMAINRNSMLLGEREHPPMPPVSDEKTVVFMCDQAEMDITKSHTVAIDKIVDDTGCPSVQPLQRNSYRKSINERANLSVPAVSGDKTVVFSCDQDEMDITKSHTTAIDNRVVDEAEGSNTQTLQRNSNRKSMTGLRMSSFPIDQTIVFSKTEDDMDLTNNYSMTVNRNPMLLAERHRFPVPPVSDEKTVVFVCDQAEMDVTKSLTVAIDNKVVDDTGCPIVQPLQRSTNRKNMTDRANLAVPAVYGDKTVVFSCNQDEMDITKSHTAAIDNRVVDEAEGSSTQALPRNSNRKSITGLRMSSVPIDQAIALSKIEDDMDLTKSHSMAINRNDMLLDKSQLLPSPGISSDKAVVFTCDHNAMDITKFHIVATDCKVADDAGCPIVQPLQRNTNRQTMTEKTNLPVPPVFVNNPVMFTCDQDDINEKSYVAIDTSAIKNDDNETLKKQILDSFDVLCQDTPTSICSQSLEKLSKPKSGRLSENIMDSHTSIPESVENEPIYVSLEQCVKKEETCARQLQHIPTLQFPVHNEEQTNLNQNELNKCLSDGNLEVIDDTRKWVSNVEKSKVLIIDQESINACINIKKMENEEMTECENIININTSFSTAEQLPCVATTPVESVSQNALSHKEFRQTSIADIHIKLKSLKRKPELCSDVDHTEQSHKAASHPDSCLQLEVLPQTHLSGRMPGGHIDDEYLEGREHKTEDNQIAPVEAEFKNRCKLKRMPFGAYPAKLPNKRNSNVSDTVCMEERTDFHLSDLYVDSGKTPRAWPNIVKNMNMSEYINEEMLPPSLEDLDSNGSVKVEVPEWTQEEICEKEALHNLYGSEPGEINKSQKRVRDAEEKAELLKKKIKRNEVESDCNTNSYQASHITNTTVPDNLAETGVSENIPTTLAKSLDGNYSSSSSQDSRIDGTSVDLGSQRCSPMEAQFLIDGDSDHSLRQKLQDGVITVREFFLLLDVCVQIQRPRHSELPVNCKLISDPTLEDLLFDQSIYYPKLLVYREDCQALCQAIEELKLYVSAQDKPLVDVNSLLWEAMKTCSNEELRNFGLELERMKSCFMKKSKIMCHKEKVKLYSKLRQTSQVQLKKLQSTNDELDCLLEEMDSCISVLKTETVKLEESGLEKCVVGCDSKLTHWRTELENLKTQESKCFSELSKLEEQKQKLLTQINNLQKEAKTVGKQLERYNFSEWDLCEWTRDHAIFTFLYDSIELTITYGEPIDVALFNNKPCRTISDVAFESLIDDDRAPTSSLLVHRLIFQYIESKGSLPMKYTTQHQLPQLLFEISLVVNRCRLLGEEIEFLMKWGALFDILKTEVHNTEVKLLFSSSAAMAKFELTICLSSNYPACPLSIIVLKHIGNIGQDEIYTVLSDVPLGTNYLRRAVKRIHQNLLQETPPLSAFVKA
ncbi:outer kinetochore KNL1 complex subunit KNL1 [Microcaecilia unicolor]|uniref:Kinetochore scaffold 1 n=1 Tax=Microcaecilia unicolor TaxID=1415580 RepID=A0A6P7Z275_9AMPH|nr:kinetochore scaffold 1 [Microcaecilia unicolor]